MILNARTASCAIAAVATAVALTVLPTRVAAWTALVLLAGLAVLCAGGRWQDGRGAQ